MYLNRGLKAIKEGLRKKYRLVHEDMSPAKKRIMDERIANNLFLLDKYVKNKIVLTYVSKDIEISTYSIMKDAWNSKKRVAVPKCDVKDHRMEFYYINSFNDLEKGMFGVYEPMRSENDRMKSFSNGICIVPGFCFDMDGYRIGYGKGYYDRFLNQYKGFTVGLCYSNCVKFKLPRGKYDKAVDILVTDKYVKKIYRPRKDIHKIDS